MFSQMPAAVAGGRAVGQRPHPRFETASRVYAKLGYLVVAGLIVAAVIIPTVASAILPLSSDQGLYITIGELLKRGGVVARDTWDIKPPGIYYLYAAVLAFAPDYSVSCAFHVQIISVSRQVACAQIVLSTFDALYAIAVAMAVWWIGWRLFGQLTGVLGGLLCAIFGSMLQITVGGGIADAYLLLPTTLAYAAAIRYGFTPRLQWLVVAGMSGALAALLKQTALITLAGIAVWLLSQPPFDQSARSWSVRLRNAGLLAAGAGGVFIITGVLLASAGALKDEISQAFLFNLYYVGQPANVNAFVVQLVDQTRAVFTGSQLGLWVCAAAGLALLLASTHDWRTALVLAWAGSSALTIVAGGSQLHVNYYLALVPPLSVLGGFGLATIWNRASLAGRLLTVGATLISLAASSGFQYHQFGNAWYSRIVSNTHSTEEFVAGSIGPGSGSLFVWGNGPQVYALSGRPPASRYLHTLGLSYDYAIHNQLAQNRAELLATLESEPPQVIAIDQPWIRRAHTLEFPELDAFIARDYDLANTPTNPIFDGWQIYRRRASPN